MKIHMEHICSICKQPLKFYIYIPDCDPDNIAPPRDETINIEGVIIILPCEHCFMPKQDETISEKLDQIKAILEEQVQALLQEQILDDQDFDRCETDY